MAEENQSPSPAPPQHTPPISQPLPNIDHYQKLVDMAHKEIEWVQGKYKLAASILGLIAVAAIGVLGFYLPKTMSDLKKEIKDEAAITRSAIQRELDLYKEIAKSEFKNYLDKQIADQFGEPRIKKTLEEVAKTRASEIIESEVRAPIEQVKKSTAEAIKASETLVRQSVENLEAIKKQIAEVQERETLRMWAMILPSGRDATDIHGAVTFPDKKREGFFGKVFASGENIKGFQFGGPKSCSNEEYINDTRKLIDIYPASPYAYAVLAYCLKINNNSSWKEAADKARDILEKLIRIQPHVKYIDGFYHDFLIPQVYGVKNLEELDNYIQEKDGVHIIKKEP